MRNVTGLVLAITLGICTSIQADQVSDKAAKIIKTTGVDGGLVLHVGSGDGTLTSALRAGDSYLVHGLDTDGANVAKARSYINSKGLGAAVSISQFDGKKLPCVDNTVRLLVAEKTDVPAAEITRVLAPGGTAWVAGKVQVKPRPEDIDEWTHYLHSPGNNAVADDKQIGPPRYTQWDSGPYWTRNHHKLNSISSVVTSGNRIFFIIDEATPANMSIPGKWKLVARDAFSGVLLWKMSLKNWAPSNRIGFRSGPANLTRLLIATGNTVYAPLGLGLAVTKVDAKSGKIIATLDETKDAEEMILTGETLLVVTKADGDGIRAVDVKSGKLLWEWKKPKDTEPDKTEVTDKNKNKNKNRNKKKGKAPSKSRIQPVTLASDGKQAYVQVGEGVIAIKMSDGSEAWTYGDTKKKTNRITFARHTLVVVDGVVLCNINGNVHAMSADKGEKMWQQRAAIHGFHDPLDIFVIKGKVWLGAHRKDSIAPPAVRDFSQGIDLKTGEAGKKNQVIAQLQSAGHHHRCYREKATTRYIIAGKRGLEFMDLEGDNHSRNNWVRGTCQYGVMPANGMVYTPPTSCGCYMESLLHSFYALSNKQAAFEDESRVIADKDRLTKGPAYGKVTAADPSKEDWPTYRQNGLRSATTPSKAPESLKSSWSTELGGRLTQPVVAAGKVFVASTDTGTLYAIDAAKGGEPVWEYIAGGRIDSPPTYHKGMVLFGSGDGNLYALQATDGKLVWRFACAPMDLRTVSHDRVESLWPVHGSVLVDKGVVYCSAGKSTWIDKGIFMYGLDPASGKILHKRQIESEHPKFEANKDKAEKKHNRRWSQNSSDYKTFLHPDKSNAFSMAGGTKTDILVSNGNNIFMHQMMLDSELKPSEQMGAHLFSTSHLLDDDENHRSHWMLGTADFSEVNVAYSWIVNRGGGFGQKVNPYGVILAYNDDAIYGLKRNRSGYQVFSRKNTPFSEYKIRADIRTEKTKKEKGKGKNVKPKEDFPYQWQVNFTMRPRAVVKAANLLIAAGHPKKGPNGDENAPYEGRSKGTIHIINPANGKEISNLELPGSPVWDGVAVAGGKIYVSTSDGKLTCIGGK